MYFKFLLYDIVVYSIRNLSSYSELNYPEWAIYIGPFIFYFSMQIVMQYTVT